MGEAVREAVEGHETDRLCNAGQEGRRWNMKGLAAQWGFPEDRWFYTKLHAGNDL